MIKRLLAGVLLASVAITAVAPAAATAHHRSSKNIVERTVGINDRTGSFDTLIAAVLCTPGIADALANTRDITVFAPTDRAFRKIGLNRHNVCTNLDDVARADVLTYHVYPAGQVSYWQARKLATRAGTPITMLNGAEAELLKKRWWGLAIDGANSRPSRVIIPNVRASNGIIHVVNNVLLP